MIDGPTCGAPANTHPLGDLDLACELLDLARHEIYDNRGNRARARTTAVLFSEDAGRLVREWEARKRSRLDPTPTSVRVHEHARAERWSDLTDQIAAEHMPTRTSACTCGGMQLGEYYPRHIAQVTEAAVRMRVERDIWAQRTRISSTGLEDDVYADAARIARGERP